MRVDQRRTLSDNGEVAPTEDADKRQGVELDATPEHHIMVEDAEAADRIVG